MTRAISTFTLAGEETKRFGGEVLPVDISEVSTGYFALTHRFPRGPVSAISPFNFPLNLIAHKVALATGSTVVVKPPMQAPLTSLLLAEILADAGSLTARSTSCTWCRRWRAAGHRRAVHAAHVHRQRQSRLDAQGQGGHEARPARARGERGNDRPPGCGPFLGSSARLWAASPMLGRCTSRCSASWSTRRSPTNGYRPSSIVGRPADGRSARSGNGRRTAHRRRAGGPRKHGSRRLEQGAELLTGGRREGRFIRPTVLTVRPDLKVWHEEVFGPVVVVERYRDFEDVARIDDSYGIHCGDLHARHSAHRSRVPDDTAA